MQIVYLPTNPTPELQSFSAPILNLQDSYVRAPFFGANYWCTMVRPVAGGNIPPQHPVVELKMIFREGGAFDYHTVFEQIKERLYNAVSLARESGRNVGSIGDVDLRNVHLEQLPAYEPAREISDAEHAEERGIGSAEPPTARDSGVAGLRGAPKPEENMSTTPMEPPNEPPPGYDEAQAQAVRFEFDQRLREEAERL
jgi:WW domain-binding protein 2